MDKDHMDVGIELIKELLELYDTRRRAGVKYFNDPNYELGQPDYARRQRWRTYGMTEEEYLDLYAQQEGKCALCEKSPPGGIRGTSLQLDHNHKTRKHRKFLCPNCNIKLGSFENWLDNGVNYLDVLDYLGLLDHE